MEQTFREFEGSPLRRGHLKLGQKRADGKSIDVTSLFIEKDGRPWIGIVGEYHYVRDKKENWKEELAKIKAGGITVISTYVFWKESLTLQATGICAAS